MNFQKTTTGKVYIFKLLTYLKFFIASDLGAW